MFFLKELVTEQTPILKLYNDMMVSDEEKYEILGINPSYIADKYIQKMYHMGDTWYYYRKEEENYGYPFYLVNELLGSYLAKTLKLNTVSFQVGYIEKSLGLVSKNFKKQNCKYYFGEYFSPYNSLTGANLKVDNLAKFYMPNRENEGVIESILKLFALDIYMLQKDRTSVNVQFEEILNTNEFSLAPVYDFATCMDSIGLEGIYLKNVIVILNDVNIRLLIKKYPQFSEYLNTLLEVKMSATFDSICADYHFNQDCFAYEQVKSYYKIKEETQKEYLKQYIN